MAVWISWVACSSTEDRSQMWSVNGSSSWLIMEFARVTSPDNFAFLMDASQKYSPGIFHCILHFISLYSSFARNNYNNNCHCFNNAILRPFPFTLTSLNFTTACHMSFYVYPVHLLLLHYFKKELIHSEKVWTSSVERCSSFRKKNLRVINDSKCQANQHDLMSKSLPLQRLPLQTFNTRSLREKKTKSSFCFLFVVLSVPYWLLNSLCGFILPFLLFYLYLVLQ